MKWFEQADIQKKWAAAGGVPARNDALQSPEFLNAAAVQPGVRRLGAAAAGHVERARVREPRSTSRTPTSTRLSTARRSPKEALDDIAKEQQSVLDSEQPQGRRADCE